MKKVWTLSLAFAIICSTPLMAEPQRQELTDNDDGPVKVYSRYDHDGMEATGFEFILDGRTWADPGSLNFSYINFTGDMTQADIETAIANALALWVSACPNLNFSKIGDSGLPYNDAGATPPAAGDIRIQFGPGNHGDPFPFDGVGGVLAHAFYPPPNGVTAAGDTHFDDAETWALAGAAGGGQPIDLPAVAAHEFGHALGLRHSDVGTALMAPFYTGPRVLGQDDIDAIRALYCPGTMGSVLPIDLVFLIDTTGSYIDDLPEIQAAIPAILQSINNIFPNTRLGLATFKDFPFNPYGDATDFAFQLNLALGTPTNLIRTTIENLVADGGNDLPESQYEALYQTVTGAGRKLNADADFTDPGEIAPSNFGFQAGRLPVIYLLTDADFHDSDVEAGYPVPGFSDAGRTATLAALVAAGAKVFTMTSTDPPGFDPLQAGLPSSIDVANLENEARELAEMTGGGVFNVGTSSSGIAMASTIAYQEIMASATCGDNLAEGAEQCDGTDDSMCPGTCGVDCLCPFTSCGNNAQEGGEQCDGTDDSVCPGLCGVDCFCISVPICGNNIREGAETCDGTDDSACPGLCALDCSCPGFPLTVFVSSTIHDGDLGGVAGANAECNALAEAAGLPAGNYEAWISGTGRSPATNFVRGTLPYLRVDGVPIANDWADLIDGTLSAPINVDETGVVHTGPVGSKAWTGTSSDGTRRGARCNDWRTSAGSVRGAQGRIGNTDSKWSFSGASPCDDERRIYCFQQTHTDTGPDIPGDDPKLVFVTSTKSDGDLGGTAGGDATCNALALAAGIAAPFKAWLSDSAGDPNSTFTKSNGVYKLLDETVIANDYADLTDGTILAEINVTDTLMVLPGPSGSKVWTGTKASGDAANGATCTDWTASSSGVRGAQGRTSATTSSWSFSGASPCNQMRRLYCVEQ